MRLSPLFSRRPERRAQEPSGTAQLQLAAITACWFPIALFVPEAPATAAFACSGLHPREKLARGIVRQ